VLDADAADLEVVDDAVGAGEVAHLPALARGFDVLVGREVVRYLGDPGRVEDLREPGLLELGYGQRRGDVVASARFFASMMSPELVVPAARARLP
jgi:hypothetical protein